MKSFNKNNRGFTLIELLVVIAIIGVLSSVVLASLNTARSKGADAAIRANLSNMRAQAAMYYDTNGNYSTASIPGPNVCVVGSAGNIIVINPCPGLFYDPTFLLGLKAAASASNNSVTYIVNSPSEGWAAQAKLKYPSTTTYFCVDSNGAARESSTAIVGTSVCP